MPEWRTFWRYVVKNGKQQVKPIFRPVDIQTKNRFCIQAAENLSCWSIEGIQFVQLKNVVHSRVCNYYQTKTSRVYIKFEGSKESISSLGQGLRTMEYDMATKEN